MPPLVVDLSLPRLPPRRPAAAHLTGKGNGGRAGQGQAVDEGGTGWTTLCPSSKFSSLVCPTATTDDFMPLSHSSAALSGGRKNKIYAFRVRSNGARRLASSSVDLGLLN